MILLLRLLFPKLGIGNRPTYGIAIVAKPAIALASEEMTRLLISCPIFIALMYLNLMYNSKDYGRYPSSKTPSMHAQTQNKIESIFSFSEGVKIQFNPSSQNSKNSSSQSHAQH